MRYAVVDLSNLMHRARHVTQGDAWTCAGLSLSIIFRSLRKVVREQNVGHIVFAIDASSWRYAAYPAYKARRKLVRLQAKPAEQEENEVFYAVLKNLVSFLHEKTNCTVLEHKGIEGDDFVARWIQLHPNDDHVIVSGDSDFVQLLAPNVTIYDGVQDLTMTLDGIFNAAGQRLEFSVKPQNGKIKIGKPDNAFIPEPDWVKKALFVKIIRGDPGDGIFSAYPGVRYNGSAKKEGIAEVWEDRHAKGYHWNNFFQSVWQKSLLENGVEISKPTRVLDEYQINESLIDLTKQPDDIKVMMDEAIITAVQKPLIRNVGVYFLQFCGKNDLPALAQEAADHAKYLNACYQKG